MKKLLYLLGLLLVTVASFGQYNPSEHTVSNKAYGVAQDAPTDARSKFYDKVNFRYRAYVSLAEVRSYLNQTKYRSGQFDIIVNTGGTLSNGVITGGTNAVWYFKDGTGDANLVKKTGEVESVNGQKGIVIAKNADSLMGIRIDTASSIPNGYVLAYDNALRRWYMLQPSTGSTLTQGAGIIIASGVVSADNTTAMWNASQLRGRNLSSGTPAVGAIVKWTGTNWDYLPDLAGLSGAYISSDTLYLLVPTLTTPDTIKVSNMASKTYVDAAIAAIPLNPTITTDGTTILGDGSQGDPVRADTLNYLASQYQILLLNERADSIVTNFSGGTGLTEVTHDVTLLGLGTAGSPLKVDTATIATRSWVTSTFTTPDGSETKVTQGANITVSGAGTIASPYVVTGTGSPTSNPFKALSIETYGGVANATVPASGANANGTNATPALEAMYAAAAEGQWIIIPSGRWLLSTSMDSLTTKRIYLLIIGDTYHNQQNGFVIKASSGPFRQHRIIHTGFMHGRVNLPTHSSGAAVGGRVSPNWNSFTGTAFTVYNTDQVKIWFNKIIGFGRGLEVLGGAGNGSQENDFYGGWIQECAIGISLRSLDGTSFVDKNKFFIERIGGGLAIKIDGFSGVASNGERYNGAFRSNQFHVLLEFCDSPMIAYGDITEPLFNITVEGGVNTGILSPTAWFQCKLNNDDVALNSSNNYVRSPKWTGQGVYGSQRVGNAGKGTMGVDGTIKVPIWNGGTYYGNEAIIDGSGQINIFTRSNLSQTQRTGAQSYIKFINYETPETQQLITSATYTPATADRVVYYNSSAGTATLPSASAFPTRRITFVNIHATAALQFTSTNIAPGFMTYCPPKRVVTYRSDGALWYPDNDVIPIPINLTQINGFAGSGTNGWVATTDGTTGGAAWRPNLGGYTSAAIVTNSAVPVTMATATIPDNTAGQIEVIIVGYYAAGSSSGDMYREHTLQAYSKKAGVLTLKGSETTLASFTADIAPAVGVGGTQSGNNYLIRAASSVTAESIVWAAYYIVRPTFTIE